MIQILVQRSHNSPPEIHTLFRCSNNKIYYNTGSYIEEISEVVTGTDEELFSMARIHCAEYYYKYLGSVNHTYSPK